jgi:hypothetical protein
MLTVKRSLLVPICILQYTSNLIVVIDIGFSAAKFSHPLFLRDDNASSIMECLARTFFLSTSTEPLAVAWYIVGIAVFEGLAIDLSFMRHSAFSFSLTLRAIHGR